MTHLHEGKVIAIASKNNLCQGQPNNEYGFFLEQYLANDKRQLENEYY